MDFVHDGSLDLKLLFKAVIAEPSAFAAWFARRHLFKTTLVIVLEGDWQAGERIPSIRELAVELGVNPNTVTRSYQVLLDWGIVVNQRGRGYFVNERAAERALTAMREDFVREEVPRINRAMQVLGIGIDELAGFLDQPTGEQET